MTTATETRTESKASKSTRRAEAERHARDAQTRTAEALDVHATPEPAEAIAEANARLAAPARLAVNAARALRGAAPLADDEEPGAAETAEALAMLARQNADLQRALNETPDPQAGKDGNAQAIEIETECDALETLIVNQTGELLRYHVARGRIVRRIINASLRKARNDQTRKNQRTAALRAAELRALAVYDADAESKPNPDRWNRLAALADLFPDVENLANVGAADALTVVITRDDPPAAWDAPETWSLKPHFERERVDAIIKTAIAERYGKDDMTAAVETLYGAEPEQPRAKQKDDAVTAAKKAATRIMGQINERKIDPATLFDALKTELERYGWRLTIVRNAQGVESIKPVKIERDEVIKLPAVN